jgi:glyoxylase I family protein
MTEIIGIDHIYISVSNLEKSELFYDTVMKVLGFQKTSFTLDDEKHIQYYNRHFGYVLRPARTSERHNSYSPGLHHLCFRVESEKDVCDVASRLAERGIEVSGPRLYTEYAADYFALFLPDPDGIRLEITNFRQERRERHENWNKSEF